MDLDIILFVEQFYVCFFAWLILIAVPHHMSIGCRQEVNNNCFIPFKNQFVTMQSLSVPSIDIDIMSVCVCVRTCMYIWSRQSFICSTNISSQNEVCSEILSSERSECEYIYKNIYSIKLYFTQTTVVWRCDLTIITTLSTQSAKCCHNVLQPCTRFVRWSMSLASFSLRDSHIVWRTPKRSPPVETTAVSWNVSQMTTVYRFVQPCTSW